MPWGFDSLSFRLACALGRAAEVPGFQPGEVGSTPTGHSDVIGDRLMAGCLPLKQEMEVRALLPELCSLNELIRGSCCW